MSDLIKFLSNGSYCKL